MEAGSGMGHEDLQESERKSRKKWSRSPYAHIHALLLSWLNTADKYPCNMSENGRFPFWIPESIYLVETNLLEEHSSIFLQPNRYHTPNHSLNYQ